MDNQAVNNYVALFRQVQQGGGADYPVFRGARYVQSGAGIGDFFRKAAGFLLPLLFQGVGTFAGETLRAKQSGSDWKTAAKGAIAPTVSNVLTKTAEQISGTEQSGSGKRRPKTKQYKRAKRARRDEFKNWNF